MQLRQIVTMTGGIQSQILLQFAFVLSLTFQANLILIWEVMQLEVAVRLEFVYDFTGDQLERGRLYVMLQP